MDAMVMLVNEIPWIMAPAVLAAGLLAASVVRAAIQFTAKSIRVMALGVMIALSAGMIMMQAMS